PVDQHQRQIVYRLPTRILQSLERGGLARAGEAGDDEDGLGRARHRHAASPGNPKQARAYSALIGAEGSSPASATRGRAIPMTFIEAGRSGIRSGLSPRPMMRATGTLVS